MGIKIQQFVCKSVNDPNWSKFINGTLFTNISNISQLGIQAPPGTMFTLNDNGIYPIYVGATGIYEIDLRNYGFIDKIQFYGNPWENDPKEPLNKIYVDIIYEEASLK